jgi:C1A family cysteine protease
MKKGKLKIVVLIIIILIIFLGILIYGVLNFTGRVIESEQQFIIVKFTEDPGIYESSALSSLFLFWKPKVNTKFDSVNNLNKKYSAYSFNPLFRQIKGLENTYEIKIKKRVNEAIEEFKQDPNVEYARISEIDFEKKVKEEVDKINEEIKKQNLGWTAGYNLQSIMTNDDKKKLAGALLPQAKPDEDLPQAKPSGGGSSGSGGKSVCTDSDGGTNINVKGTVSWCSGSTCASSSTDYCSSSTQVKEYKCGTKSGTIYGTGYTCLYGCSDGACVASNYYDKYPKNYDWRNINGKNYITPVKNQGSCGSCTAFAMLGALEGEINAYYNNLLNLDLSEQNLVSCSSSNGCSGLYVANTLSYLKTSGACGETCFPYTSTNNNCANKCSSWQSSTWKINSSERIYSLEGEFKKYLFEKGPIFTTMDVYNDFYSYQGGIYSVTPNSPYLGYHAVTLVGYGIDNSNGKTYWIAKNSWGTSWGEAGFFRIYAGQSKLGGDTHYITSPIPPTGTNPTRICEDKDAE